MQFALANLCDPEEELDGRYIDDLRGTEMDPVLTRKARQEQLDAFRRRNVYEVVPRSMIPRNAKVVGIRWVETDKGVPGNAKIRSRLVAQTFATKSDPTGELFAPTPPLAATRWLISGAASNGKQGPGNERLMSTLR